MRITRLQHGIAVHMTDNEWTVLCTLVSACEAGPLPDYESWSPAEKAAYTRQTAKRGQFLAIDRDRRS
jgi:hypothetical protein